MLRAFDDLWWLERGVPPQVADEMPWQRKLWIGRLLDVQDKARQDKADAEQREADKADVEAEHARKMASMGRNPDGTKLGS